MLTHTHLEREMKFAVGWDFDLPDLRGVAGRAVRQPEKTFRTAYFDTPDLRLWKRGIALRFRGPGDGTGTWTVKLPAPPGAATLDRQEVSWAGLRAEMPADARDLLLGLVRRASLDQIVETATTRLTWALCDHAGDQWAEVDYDEVTVVGGPADGLRYRQVEVEATGNDATEHTLSAVAGPLRRAGAQFDQQPKMAKALGLSASQPAGKVDEPVARLRRSSTGADLVRHAIFDGLERLLDHDYQLRLRRDDPDPHHVHQARVATRRLRSNLKTLRPLLDRVWLSHAEEELRWLGGTLGAVRDADVMSGSLGSTGSEEQSSGADAGSAELSTKLAEQRAEAVSRLSEALSSPRYLDLLDRLHAAASRPPLTDGQKPAPKVIRKAVRKRWSKIDDKVARADRSASDPQLHSIRIAAKNLRYASELARPVIGKRAAKTAKLAENVQTVLGQYHDASTAVDWLAAAGSATARGGFRAGVLTAEQDRRRRKLAKQWRHRWTELAQPSHRRWFA